MSMVGNSKRKQLERDIEHVTQEMYKRNKELAETNKTLSLLRTIDSLVLESHMSISNVCQRITEAISEATDYSFVGLFTHSLRSKDELALFGWSGKNPLGVTMPIRFSHPLHLKLNNPWLQKAGGDLMSLSDMEASDIAASLGTSPADITQLITHTAIKALYAVRLYVRHRLIGVLVVGFTSQKAEIDPSDILLIDRLSENIGVALDNKLLFEENQHVLHQLRESNTKLKALDEAKDDFISMASHQLRTPLTSVKGYMSMVLEGDAGKITPTQKELLQQAFFSSQRMVYLIADLLNVSRLGTGKFVIDTMPVDLARVVGEEVEQLRKIAAIHDLTLTYEKPKKLPQLLLDETKTRQVIMNFIDNALYYTPAGGHVTVRLLDKPSSIELRIEDNGIGVPKREQQHLFTKFYRAGNARKTRPDGTGLGLFMAKKVIIAEGGALIFESREGQGSTFGFTFRKDKLATPAHASVSVKD